ncbi:glycosyltransferase family 2 protein [Colwellia sp. E2M01]|uniref:glycosyltransferase family 2 protein n=1 Tax=Colwellia sp. E2M01 TaxID=2841561 RepID=UPI001C08676F|nr:glycosyltransferase family 2 protein [Colwellia sp. E2M01]MBU2870950.1 glycosyltransferase [Colwellia sp. E2M01]
MNNSIKYPLISVYMPTKNRSTLLKKAIDSVLSQDYKNFELIIINDGSIDKTFSILQDYQNKHKNIHCFHNKTSVGISRARNQALENCSGEFVTGLDDDDHFYPDRLSSLMNYYDDKYSFICSSVVWDFGTRKKVADSHRKIINLTEQLNYNHATTQVLVKKERLILIGGFDNSLVARIDYDAWTRLIEMYGCALRIAHPSYILNRYTDIERVTSSNSDIIGNHQFLAKHKRLMNTHNLINHEFRDLYARNAPYSFRTFISHLPAGYMLNKLKYYIRINFLPRWHK